MCLTQVRRQGLHNLPVVCRCRTFLDVIGWQMACLVWTRPCQVRPAYMATSLRILGR